MIITMTDAADSIPEIWDRTLLRQMQPPDELMARVFGMSVLTYRRWRREWEREDDRCSECGRPYDEDNG
jgi:hypothetical protein